MFIVINEGIKFLSFNLKDESLPYSYKDLKIINENDKHYISLNNHFHFEDGRIKEELKIKKYIIKQNHFLNDIELFVYKDDVGLNSFVICRNLPLIFANHPKAHIINSDAYLKGVYLCLKDKHLITNYEYLLLNDQLYAGEELKKGDKVRLLNFSFYYYEDFLYINSFYPFKQSIRKDVEERIIKYENKKPSVNNYYLPVKKDIEIKKLKEYKPIHIQKSKKLIFQIGPSITMSLAMISIAGINIYNNYLNSNNILNSLIYIMMPLTMLISGVFWPLIGKGSEKKENKKLIDENKKQYLSYLTKYEKEIEYEIRNFLKQERSYYFAGQINEERLFYITDKNESFLNISIGLIKDTRDFEYKECDDEEITEALSRIKYRLNNIEDCPYFLNLKKYRFVSVCADNKLYFMKKILLELSYKYHYDDFYLAIYSKEINNYEEFFGLPQLIFNNNRLTLNKKRELQELNALKIDKPLIILADSHIDYLFTNNQIKLIYFTNDKNDLYKDSEVLIEYLNMNGYIYEKEKIPFKYLNEDIDFKYYGKQLSSYQKLQTLDRALCFKDVYSDLNIQKFYETKQEGLRADFALIGKEILNFDLHEKKNGPHGLIGGSTGSGKSELIISLLLSLCIRYRPDYLNIILIDYKGGGIEESLSANGKSVPHIVAKINNLENDIFERLIVAIDFECKRRQRLFKKLSNKAMTSIMNIDDYLEYNNPNYNLPNIAHLLIVVDEFAELKKENSLFIKELISFSRIGRSLGLHLLLATQRPSGIIDDEIWSNSRFKIALKVLSEKDSNDIIKTKDAAYLNNPGEFYLAIDDNLFKGKALYSKYDQNNGEAYEVSLLNNRLEIIQKKSYKKHKSNSEATYLVKRINETSELLNIKNEKIEFNKPIPLSKKDLSVKYKCQSQIIGEIDDYLNAYKNVLCLPQNENIFIYSTRNKEINNILNNINRRCVVIGSKIYKNKYISDSLLYEDNEDISYLFNKLINDNEDLCLVIEDLSCLLSYDENINNYLYQLLRRSLVSNINIIALSKQSSISFKLLNSFKYKYAIKINDHQDLLNIFSGHNDYKGDSYFYDERIIPFVPCIEEEFISDKSLFKPYIERIPERIKLSKDDLLVGYNLKNRLPVYLEKKEKTIITAYDNEYLKEFKEIFIDYPNIEILEYKEAINRKDVSCFLWLGQGLYSQRLFYIDGKIDLEKNLAYYFKGNKGVYLKTIKYE